MLNFQKGKISFEERVWRTEARHHTKYCWSWSIGSIHRGDIAIFRVAVVAILNIWIPEILLADGVWGQVASLCQILSRWTLLPSWICLGAYLDDPQRLLGASVTLQNLVMIAALVFIIWTFQYLARLAGKRLFTPLPPPKKMGFLGNLIPKMGCNISRSQKGTPLRESASFEQSSVKIWRGVWRVGESLKTGYKDFGLYFTYLPMEGFPPNFAQL